MEDSAFSSLSHSPFAGNVFYVKCDLMNSQPLKMASLNA